jgi:mRNA-degrading endonuclease RelE of RelBE toxin-antitoxin system
MSSAKSWRVTFANRARKTLRRVPERDRARLVGVLERMAESPLVGDVVAIARQRATYRRRVGSWRILFEMGFFDLTLRILSIERRTSTTYRRR